MDDPLSFQKQLHDAVGVAFIMKYRELVGDGAIVCDENCDCGDCPWTMDGECGLEVFETQIL